MNPLNIVIAMSIPGDSPQAHQTASRIAEALGLPREDIRVGIAIESDQPRTGFNSFLMGLKNQYAAVAVWDKYTNDAVLAEWAKQKNAVWPVYDEFSYGAFQNKALIVADAGDFTAVVRLDPGTTPPRNLEKLIFELLDKLNGGVFVVSSQYDGRLALRSDFMPSGRLEEYYNLIQEYTGIDPRFGKQVTAGAALTILVAGPPAPVFRGLKIWASDDGFYTLAFGLTRATVLPDLQIAGPRVVSRSESGYPLDPNAYAGRLANAVLLREALAGSSRIHARSKAAEFLRLLAKTAPGKVIANSVGLRDDLVFEGYANWRFLCDEWSAARRDMVKIIHNLPSSEACLL